MHDVLIVGGGIGGLTAALALRARGIDAHVYEEAPALRAVGAGILVPPNAMQILARLHLADAVAAEGVVIERAELRDCRSGVLQVVDLASAARRHGAPTIAIHRARLQEALRGRLPAEALHLGAKCTDVSHRGDGMAGSVEARFEDGRTAQGTILVGADGAGSVVRSFVAARAKPRYSGQTAYRGLARQTLAPALVSTGFEMWAPKRRFGYAALGGGDTYWFATFDAPPDARDAEGTAGTMLAARFADFGEPAASLIAATPPSEILRTDLTDLAPLPSWHVGRIVLLGDAAHASTPNLGQGGAQAIEDAWVLADRLAHARDGSGRAMEQALAAYERTRAPKANLVVRQSRRMGQVAHLSNPLGRAVRNAVIRFIPTATTQQRLDRFYTVDY